MGWLGLFVIVNTHYALECVHCESCGVGGVIVRLDCAFGIPIRPPVLSKSLRWTRLIRCSLLICIQCVYYTLHCVVYTLQITNRHILTSPVFANCGVQYLEVPYLRFVML